MGRPTFEVTKRAQPGQRQYANVAEGYNRGTSPGPYVQLPSDRVIVPYAGAAVTQPGFVGSQTDPRMGYDNNPWGARLTQPAQSGWSSGAGYVAPQSFYNQFQPQYSNKSFAPQDSPYKYSGIESPFNYEKPPPNRQQITSADRAEYYIQQAAAPGVTEAQVKGVVGSIFADFQSDVVKWETARDEAMADGQAELADQYDQQAKNVRQSMAEYQREIDSSVSVEQWFRDRIQGPFEAAKAAALAVDTQPILDLAPDAAARQAELAVEKNTRMEGILSDLGFTPEQAAAMKAGATQDNAVLAAEAEVLAALGTRPGLLDARKQLAFYTADEQRLENLRTSAGSQMVVEAVNRRKLAQSEDQLKDIEALKAKSMARAKRAVERAYGDGPQLPGIDNFTDAAMSDMLQQLAGDLPPAQQKRLSEIAWGAINGGLGKVDAGWAYRQVINSGGGIDPSGQTTQFLEGLALQDNFITMDAAGEWTGWNREGQALINKYIADNLFDDEDYGIINSLISTYGTSRSEYQRIADTKQSASTSSIDNTSTQNRADAENGVGAFGDRRSVVESWADKFKYIFDSPYVTGIDAGYRDITDPGGVFKIANSNHKTGGAIDIFINANDPKAMEYWKYEMAPFLDRLLAGGVLMTVLEPGYNDGHKDHAHLDFALPGISDSWVNTNV